MKNAAQHTVEDSMNHGETIVKKVMDDLASEQSMTGDDGKKPRIPLTHRTWAKVSAFLLVIVMTVVTVLSAIGAVLMIEWEFYTTPKEFHREALFEQIAETLVRDAAYRVLAGNEDAAIAGLAYRNIQGVILDLRAAEGRIWTYGDTSDSARTCYESAWLLMSQSDIRRDHGYYTAAQLEELGAHQFTARVYFTDPLVHNDALKLLNTLLDAAYALRFWIYAIALAAFILAVVMFVFLLRASGRRNGAKEPHPGWGTIIPFDLLTAATALALLILIALIVNISYFQSAIKQAVVIFLCSSAAMVLVLGWCMSAALRWKLGKWWQNTLIFHALRLVLFLAKRLLRSVTLCIQWIAALLRSIPLVWKTAVLFAAVTVVELLFLIMFIFDAGMVLVGWFLERLVVFGAAIWIALGLRRLQKGGEALAEGDLAYQVDTKGMPPDFKRHAEHLSMIGQGMTAAVEQRLKSERMKTELITNVSHDIKTPLTSIINYSDLIGREPCENERITEYAEVLHRQSERLKRLIDDLVEASKASTGNLEVFLAPCEVGVLLTQTAGEYEQRLAQCDLSLMVKQPETPVKILADGRRLWRVFDNLMNNICKYALPGTRVYLTLEAERNEAVISFKNTSREPLDLTADELMERFVRGDAARNSEGSGLGLSIARSLTQLQNGDLSLTVDGDLFKAVLRFPVI